MVKRDLKSAVKDAGFTPSVKHVGELATLAGDADDDVGEAVERALGRMGAALAPALEPAFATASPRALVHLCRALGRAGDAGPVAVKLLAESSTNETERVRRAAASAMGKIGGSTDDEGRARLETLLLDAWHRASTDSERRVIAEALGKIGGERARELLQAFVTRDEQLLRVLSKAKLVLERTERRREHGGIRGEVAPPRPLPIVFFTRRGLEHVVIDQLSGARAHGGPRSRGWNASVDGDGRVRATLHGPLSSAWSARSAERFALALPDVPLGADDDMAQVIAESLVAFESVLETMTEGAIRFRVAWARGGHRRALVWKIAEAVSARSTSLVNDPTESLWELVIDERKRPKGPVLSMVIVPRGLDDPRFVYRTKDVPAASHPTVAAALAHVASVSPDDVVWDPFMGSGLELVERAKLGPYRALFGSDLEDAALDAARTNLANAGVQATLERADALTRFPEGTTLVLTNPPMGRRVHRHGDIGDFLAAFVTHVAEHLPAGGRLVWLSSQSGRTRAAATEAGLIIDAVGMVDMGGFDAELQIFAAPRAPRTFSRPVNRSGPRGRRS